MSSSVYDHEASHAAVAVILGVPLRRVWCDGRRGAVELHPWRRCFDDRRYADVAAATVAGAIENGRESSSDRKALGECVKLMGAWGRKQSDRWADLARLRARRLLSAPTARRAVKELAEKLRYVREVDGAEATAIIRLLLGLD